MTGGGHHLVAGRGQLAGELQAQPPVRPGHDHSPHPEPPCSPLRLLPERTVATSAELEEPWDLENCPLAGGVCTTWRSSPPTWTPPSASGAGRSVPGWWRRWPPNRSGT